MLAVHGCTLPVPMEFENEEGRRNGADCQDGSKNGSVGATRIGDEPNNRNFIWQPVQVIQSLRCRDEGMFAILRYFVTVRRATG